MKKTMKLSWIAIGLLAVPIMAAGAGKATFKEFTVKKIAETGHNETIEIASWSLGTSNPSAAKDSRSYVSGYFSFTANSVPPSVGRLCQSHATLSSMTIESDGQTREFHDVAFKECPAGGAGTFTLTFNGQTTTPGAPAGPTALEIPNVTITGLTRMQCQNNLKQMSLGVHTATLIIGTANGGVWKTTDGGPPAAGTQFPTVVIEGRGGTKVTFFRVTLKDALITGVHSTQPGAAPAEVQTITLTYESTTATQPLIDAILAGR